MPCAARLEGCDSLREPVLLGDCPVTRWPPAARPSRTSGCGSRAATRTSSPWTSRCSTSPPGAGSFFLAHIPPDGAHRASHRPEPGPSGSAAAPFARSRESPDVRARKLTAREVEVLGMLAAGQTTAEIARGSTSRPSPRATTSRTSSTSSRSTPRREAVAFAFQKHLKLSELARGPPLVRPHQANWCGCGMVAPRAAEPWSAARSEAMSRRHADPVQSLFLAVAGALVPVRRRAAVPGFPGSTRPPARPATRSSRS